MNELIFPSPYNYKTYEEFSVAVRKWRRSIERNEPKKEISETNSAFFRYPVFSQQKTKYVRSYPKQQNQKTIIENVLNSQDFESEQEKILAPPYDKWIMPPTNWQATIYGHFPYPEFSDTKEKFTEKAIEWANETNAIINRNFENFNKGGTLIQKSDILMKAKSDPVKILNYPTPKKLCEVLNIREAKPSDDPYFHQKKPELHANSEFYVRVQNKYREKQTKFNDVGIIIALKGAYESIPFLPGRVKLPATNSEASKYGPTSHHPIPRSLDPLYLMKDREMRELTPLDLHYFETKKPYEIPFEHRKWLYDTMEKRLLQGDYTILDSPRLLYIIVWYISEVEEITIHLDHPVFDEAESLNSELILQVHNSCANVILFRALFTMLSGHKVRKLLSFLKESVRVSDNNLHNLLSQNSDEIIKELHRYHSVACSKTTAFIFSVVSYLSNQEAKKFTNQFSFSWCIAAKLYAPEFVKNMCFIIISHRNLLISLLTDFSQHVEAYIEYIDGDLLQLCITMFGLQGNYVPKICISKVEWIVLTTSHLLGTAKREKKIQAAEFCRQMIKMIVRAKKMLPTLKAKDTKEWDSASGMICGLLCSLIEDISLSAEYLPLLKLEVDTFAALVPEKGGGTFFKTRERAVKLFNLCSHPIYSISHLGFKILTRLLMYQSKEFFQMIKPEDSLSTVIAQQFRQVQGPAIIDVFEMIRKFVEAKVPADDKTEQSGQASLFLTVVNIPTDVITFIQFVKNSDFNPSTSLKAIKYMMKNPDVPPRLMQLTKFRTVFLQRRSTYQLLFTNMQN